MNRSLKQVMVVGALLCLTIASQGSWAQGAAESKAAGKHAALLKGVVHLSDNDVRFRTAGGLVLLVDPMAGPSDPIAAGKKMARPDLILITHSHGDHFDPDIIKEYIKVNPEVILAGPEDVCREAKENGIDRMKTVAPGNEYSMAGAGFLAVPAYFPEGKSHPKENGWVGYVLRLDGASYYVTGDAGPMPEIAGLEADVIFPLLWGCGGNVDQAVEMTGLSKASLVVPVHHGGHLEAIEKFMSKLPEGTEGFYFAEGELKAVH